ncbi:MAG: HAD-IB family hydrolase [Bifidobacteriaceae bacterium]|jgi:HAD superfamily hydrolase (TIGR01490 family)|nr:HAD-IB family hydrolase [Bifidobacteriaceae bacterium]
MTASHTASPAGPSPDGEEAAPRDARGGSGLIAAFFDIDNTLVRGASAFHLARALRRRGLLRARTIAAYALRHAKYQWRGERAKDLARFTGEGGVGVVSGISVAEVVAVGEELYDEVLAHRIFPATKQLLDQHRAAGHEVWLVSASPVEIGSLIASRFGATGALGTIPEREDGFYTGRLVGGLLHGPAKADAIGVLATDRGIALNASFAYGDSISDVPLLSAVGNPCGINPDRKLRRYCAELGWPTRDFRGRRRAVRRSLNAAWRLGATWALFHVLRSLLRRHRRP